MKVAIMQPYFLPYIGYFQLIDVADAFVVYDNIKYTKKGWINRNRYLSGGTDALFSLPLKKDSDHLHVVQREISPDFAPRKLLNQLREAYRKAPYAEPVLLLLEAILVEEERNLFRFILGSIERTCAYLGISTPIVTSSTIDIDHGLQGQEKVIALCKALGAEAYVNPIGGTELYDGSSFASEGISLEFLRSNGTTYPQLGQAFVPWLSIIDVMMFNSPEDALRMVKKDFVLLKPPLPAHG